MVAGDVINNYLFYVKFSEIGKNWAHESVLYYVSCLELSFLSSISDQRIRQIRGSGIDLGLFVVF